MRVESVRVYGIDESMIASGYPMKTDTDDFEYETQNLNYWLNLNLKEIINIIKNDDRFQIDNNVVFFRESNIKFLISPEDIVRISKENWVYNKTREYLVNTTTHVELHRFIANEPDDKDIDHINRDKKDYRRDNLRICTHRENTINRDLLKNNTSGFMGVYFRKDRQKWVARIEVNKKAINLGHYENIDDAIITRLQAEKELFGEFAPQRHLFEQYNIDSISESNIKEELGFTPSLENAIKHYKRVCNLGNSKPTSGHDNFLNGIVVQFDLTFSNKAWVELQRYHFIDFVSSQSTMHKIAKFDLSKQYNEYVDKRIIIIMEELKDKYNQTKNREDYLKLLYSNPAGFQLTARMTTNYRQIKTIYNQRKTHRLPEWQEFCKWVETLPMFKELCLAKEE